MSTKQYRIQRRHIEQYRRRTLKEISDPTYQALYHAYEIYEITDPKLRYSGTKYRGSKHWYHAIEPFIPKEYPNVVVDHIDLPESSHNFNDDAQTIDGHHIPNPLTYWNFRMNHADDDNLMKLIKQHED